MRILVVSTLLLLLVVASQSHADSTTTTNLRGGGGGGGSGSSSSSPMVETRIIGGHTVDDSNRFPYFALLKGDFLCGGVLIASNLVITAAHCENATTEVIVGAYNFNGVDDNSVTIEIEQQIPHPLYGGINTTNVRSYDIMIIKLKQSISTTNNNNNNNQQQNIMIYGRLNSDPSIPEDCGTQLSSIGFGDISTQEYGAQFPQYLQLTDQLRFMNHDYCRSRHTGNTLSDDMLCATGGDITSPCNGDSGGPLFIKGLDASEDVIVGTVSWGRGCANSYHPIVYASMSYFFNWIEQTACEIYYLQEQQQQQQQTTASSNDGEEGVRDDDGEEGHMNNNNNNNSVDLPDYFDCSKYINEDDDEDFTAVSTTTPVVVLPNLQFVTWTPIQPLQNCEGDCDEDIDCDDDMICYKSNTLDIPGCLGLNSRRIVDYCIHPP